MKNVRMRPSESVDAIDAKGVIPNHPTATMKASFLRFDFQFSRKLITDRQPECARWFKRLVTSFDPLPAPIEVVFGLLSIVVHIVLVANIEWRVGKD